MKWPPNYKSIVAARANRINTLRQDADLLRGAKALYASGHPLEFIEDWAITYDPRNAGTDRPVLMPFILFPRQREFNDFLYACLVAPAHGLIEKVAIWERLD
jgi:phage terminase large subunit